MIRSRVEFVIDQCSEVDSDAVRRIGAGVPGGQPPDGGLHEGNEYKLVCASVGSRLG